jgi:hypothetical protein
MAVINVISDTINFYTSESKAMTSPLKYNEQMDGGGDMLPDF